MGGRDDDDIPLVIPENRALARRPLILGLPHGYAALLMTAGMILALGAHLALVAAWVVLVGWGIGGLLTLRDPWAWEITLAQRRVPGVIRAW